MTDDCRSTRSALENACVQRSLCELASSLPCLALPCSVHGWAHSLTFRLDDVTCMWPADTGRAMAVSTTINTTSNVESGVVASTVEVLAAVTVGGWQQQLLQFKFKWTALAHLWKLRKFHSFAKVLVQRRVEILFRVRCGCHTVSINRDQPQPHIDDPLYS